MHHAEVDEKTRYADIGFGLVAARLQRPRDFIDEDLIVALGVRQPGQRLRDRLLIIGIIPI